jgi:hypothetical protein
VKISRRKDDILYPGSWQFIFPILAALTDDSIKMVLIDELYALLQPRYQERLRKLFLKYQMKNPLNNSG